MFRLQRLNEGGFLILVACSKPYEISINFGSEPFSPPKQIPNGMPLLLYPVGTLRMSLVQLFIKVHNEKVEFSKNE